MAQSIEIPVGCQAQNGTKWNIFLVAYNRMEHLGFPAMGGKTEFLRVRSDEQLKTALRAAAERSDRPESDQARYLLRLALGLVDNEDEQELKAVKKRLKRFRIVEERESEKGGRGLKK